MPITVNGVEITDAAIQAEMQHHPAPSREIAEYAAKLSLVAQELLLQEANRLEIAGGDGEERIAALLQREVGNAEDKPGQPKAVSQYLAKLLGRATIGGVDLSGAQPPLARERG
ncbi:MAG: hypothetical protein IPP10_18620 [Candidatus Competibacteraceae bacterium]|nr:hypothetical protein [Candidatus Competibacteraceae bacterium]MBK7984938.1 hypothetical protein [Candidatus Competibacteraceae bacterium]MBK8895977.1 hypothetical protein [Candidatus Competibacteraceae bacterium]MBK8962654.1 hypothetical protein [Candidatus Competibacteraceae bacterium]MBK9953420.1 hypothetical protein [Candidatus Competibacteraceae bacterium]